MHPNSFLLTQPTGRLGPMDSERPAAPIAGGPTLPVADGMSTMAEPSLYERLGGVFAIAAVIDHFS